MVHDEKNHILLINLSSDFGNKEQNFPPAFQTPLCFLSRKLICRVGKISLSYRLLRKTISESVKRNLSVQCSPRSISLAWIKIDHVVSPHPTPVSNRNMNQMPNAIYARQIIRSARQRASSAKFRSGVNFFNFSFQLFGYLNLFR